MGITLFSFSGLFAPLQQLAGWLAGARLPVQSRPAPAPVAGAPGWQRIGGRVRAARLVRAHGPLPLRRPLRVVRVLETCRAPASAGRMVISGRMADVCAELERLAALER